MNKKTFWILSIFFNLILNAQNYINIGSTKKDVKKVMGEPNSIKNYDLLKEEVWSYGKYGLATITFKKDKIAGFNNYNNILKIGDTSKKSKLGKKQKLHDNPFINKIKQELAKDPNILQGEAKSLQGKTDLTGLGHGIGKYVDKSIPKEYYEIGTELGWNPHALPLNMEEQVRNYKIKRFLKWSLISIVIIGVLFMIYKRKSK
ncbi:hypothetical protein UJ101_01057 [Flavobacteriaceae bacterium UJ101]|nr:hypothetical protein UJ101_01057 [Flavobacteriaceae bacterium UJ101]